ncbi:DUF3237 domain-containing protein [Microbacterium bovistercoris]|uniref:DUF3237 domain-containing protein n=1 Tax=Microbacterium bovistercoris TaxID=2293570 RepID=A0A371NPT1_9MICO|nr:DUF3237 domain-containing protein [Microbacterium bovistercoris]REJ04201.1 DUF3237 domain-containing protein [Microbacterium bovistercoris]
MTAPIADPVLEHAFDVVVELGEPELHGATRAGTRRVVPIIGGRITGGVEADILPGGADWQIIRADGALDLDARYSARTAGGELLLLRARGVRAGMEGPFHTALEVETSSPALSRLQDRVFVASAVRDTNLVRYRAFHVR